MSVPPLVAAIASAASVTAIYARRKKSRGKKDLLQSVSDYCDGLVDEGVIPFISLRIERFGKTIYSHDYGTFNTPLATGAKFDADTIARFFSMTKPITSAAVLVLLEQCDHFSLDEPVSKYIPEWDDSRIKVLVGDNSAVNDVAELKTEPANRPITTRDLLTHSSGISYGFWKDEVSPTSRFMVAAGLELPCPIAEDERRTNRSGDDYPANLEEFCTRLQDVPLVAHPGTEFHYSCATDVLGRLVECLDPQRRSLDQFFADTFFTPLGMTDTAFSVGDDKLSRLAPCFYVPEAQRSSSDAEEEDSPALTSPTGKTCNFKLASYYHLGEVSRESPWHSNTSSAFEARRCPSGGGGLLSTVNDYMKFARFLHTGTTADGKTRILRNETLEMMREDNLKPRGIAKKNLATYFDGFGLGVSCVVRKDPETGEAVESLGNPGGIHSAQGTGGWSGAALTNFWIDPDPTHNITCVLATQLLYLRANLRNPVFVMRQTIAKLAMDAIFSVETNTSASEKLQVLI